MGRFPTKVGKKGKAASFISKRAAIKRLQVNEALFRRLAILRGVHPIAPEAAQSRKGNFQKNRLYYSRADIRRLESDRALETYRARRAHDLKRVKAANKGASDATLEALEAARPDQRMDLVLKERYPTLSSALRDMDDALSMLALVAAHTSGRTSALANARIAAASRLVRHFHMLMVARRAIHRVFASVRGFYFETVVAGQSIMWLVPHAFNVRKAAGVNYALIDSFSVLYEALVEFVSFKLYSMVGLPYPPPEGDYDAMGDSDAAALHAIVASRAGSGRSGEDANADDDEEEEKLEAEKAKAQPLQLDVGAVIKSVQVDEEAEAQAAGEADGDADEADVDASASDEEDETAGPVAPSPAAHVFDGIVVRISREVPRLPVELVLLSGGATVLPPYAPDEPRVETHLITDRPVEFQPKSLPSTVTLVQPQWVFDSFNFRIRLPPIDYALSQDLPPHLSPFPEANANGYVPEYQKAVEGLVARLKKERLALGLRNPVLVACDADSVWAAEREREVQAAMDSDDDNNGKAPKRPTVGPTERVVEEGDGDGALGAPEATQEGEVEDEEAERERLAALMLSRRKRRLLTGAKKKIAAREARVASLSRKAKAVQAKRVRTAKQDKASKSTKASK